MSLFEDTNPRPLKELLAQINSREAVLPDFQRDFVWDPSATQELITSIAQNYPAGSLLRIRNTRSLFACREFEGAPALNGHPATYLVLDGQQRLTSLYQAFYGVGDHRYFMRIGDLLEGRAIEDCLFFHKATHSAAKQYSSIAAQARDMVMPLSVIYARPGGFSQWAADVLDQQNSVDGMARGLTELQRFNREIGERYIRPIEEYQFPVVTLSESTSAESVCTIFETLNRTGVKLSPFELLTARYWPKNVNLRAMWAQAREEHPIIADFGVDPYYVMQSVSLVARQTPSCKRNDVLNLAAEDVERWWAPVISGLARGLSLLRDRCGVVVVDWLPSHQIIVPLAAILGKVETPKGPAEAAMLDKVEQWYWCSIFARSYDQAPNTQAASDLTSVCGWISGGPAPDTVRTFQFDTNDLFEITPKQRALYKGVMTLVLRNGPRDFHNGSKLTASSIIEEHVDDHHIFPDNFLKQHGVDATRRNCILNRTLIDRTTNQRIQDRAPSAYMAEIRTARGDLLFNQLLASHLLPTADSEPFRCDDFDAFVHWRLLALSNAIRQATGADVREAEPANVNAGTLSTTASALVV